ncbi:MAG: hypothetical protein HOH95_09375 [Dehalococcoidia bacterium]|nr:hypothetical protein [Dehalococcoidia bacterium]
MAQGPDVQVRLIANPLRPGVGRPPAREKRRAFLPQHARLIPVIEEANKLGLLVFPPLSDNESVQIHARDDDVLAITMYVGDDYGQRSRAFVAEVTRSAGAGGIGSCEITILDDHAGFDEASAGQVLDALTAGINAVPGTVGLRGTQNFITPEGWDTVYTSVLNDLQRPMAGMISTRVETDWLPHETEFRYALEGGDVLSLVGSGPIGQVFFVPRTDVTVGEASEEEARRFVETQRALGAAAAQIAKKTKYGGGFSYQYQEAQASRRRGDVGAGDGLLQDASMAAEGSGDAWPQATSAELPGTT